MGETKIDDDWRFLNDWPIRRFVLVSIGFILGLIIFSFIRNEHFDNIFLDLIEYAVFFGVIFIPGASLLRIFRIHGIGFTKALLIALALGIGFIMIVGFLLNTLHYAGVVEKPISFEPVNVAFPLIIAGLLILVYWVDKNYLAEPVRHVIDIYMILSWCLAALLPILAIIGTSVAGYDGNRQILLYLLVVLCIAPFALLSKKVKNYELFIFTISLTLLLHKSLLTDFLTGYDVFSEYTGATYVISNGYWNISETNVLLVGGGANTSLAMVSFIPMVYNLTGIETLMIFKLAFQLLYSLVPVAIFVFVREQFNDKSAVIASFVFIAFAEFYGLMIQLAKQEIAEIFLVMFLLIIFETKLPRSKKKVLSFIFVIGIMVSHYAIAFLTLGVLGLMVIITISFNLFDGWKLTRSEPLFRRSYLFIFVGLKSFLGDQYRKKIASLDIIIATGAFFLIWYKYTASGILLTTFQRGGSVVSSSTVGSNSLEPGQYTLRSLDMLEYVMIDQGSILHNLPKLLFVIVQLLCIIGVIYAVFNMKGMGKKANRDFLALGLVGGILILMAYTVPNFSSMFYYGRLFHYSMIFLSGFFLIGIVGFFSCLKDIAFIKKKGSSRINRRKKRVGFIGAVLIISAILFTNTSAIYSLVGDYNTSFAVDDSVSWSIFSDSDIAAAKWAGMNNHTQGESITADYHRFTIFNGLHVSSRNLIYNWDRNDTDTLIFISTWNSEYHYTYPLDTNNNAALTYTDLESLLQQVNDTYSIPYSAGETSYYYIPLSTPHTNSNSTYIYTYNPIGEYVLEGFAAILAITFVLAIAINRYKRNEQELEIDQEFDEEY